MLTVIVYGLAIGAIYAATALVYNVMYSTSKVLSVTTGHIPMLGGVFGAYFIAGLGLPNSRRARRRHRRRRSVQSLDRDRQVRRMLARSDEHLWLLSTLAVTTMISQVMALWWGTEPKPFPRLIPQEFAQGIGDQKYWLPVLAVAVCAGSLELFYRRTMYGKLFIATSEDAFAARARGINTDRVRALSYMLSGALGGLAGFAAGQLTFAYFALGFALTLNGFIAIAVGGLGSNLGAVIGGLALGMMSSFATYLFGGEYQQTVAIGILILVLVIKPEGLFGSKQVRPV